MLTSSKRIAVIGQGIIGLTCASRLLSESYSVDIFSKDEFENTTSMAAGAYWWPHKAYPEASIAKWSNETYNEYVKLQSIPESGVHFEKHFRFCIDPDESLYARHLLDDWEEIDGSSYGIPCKEAFLFVVPVIDVPVYMPYLRDQVLSAGARFHKTEIESTTQLFPEFDLVINCSGIGAYHLVGDKEIFPIRGQTIRISLPEELNESTRIVQNDLITLILPRSTDAILGGTAQKGNWNGDPNPEDTEIIFKRCCELLPQIADCEILGTSVGLRPGRKQVRLALELLAPSQPVIHNYGHGGSGYTVAWGCANEVAQLCAEYFSIDFVR